MIDGTAEAVGSDERHIRRMLVIAAKMPKPRLTVEAFVKDGAVSMTASGPGLTMTAGNDTDLWWAVTEDGLVAVL